MILKNLEYVWEAGYQQKFFAIKLTSDDICLYRGTLSDGEREIFSVIFPASSDIETEDLRIWGLFSLLRRLRPAGFGG